MDKRGLHVITISFNGSAQDEQQRPKMFEDAKVAMKFLKNFDANLLVVFSPSRKYGLTVTHREVQDDVRNL